MPRFQCTACGASFAVPQATIDKYPGWEPQYCRKDSPGKRKCGPRLKTPRSALGSVRGSTRTEENLPLARVLAKYDGGPASGVFTDGSAVPNPGPGGWGVVWVENGEIQEQRHGHHPDTTNNRMELTALIEAFKLLPEDATARVLTDSELCVNTITKWAPAWERRGLEAKG